MRIEEIFKNPVKRQDLGNIFDCSDREARERIAELQDRYNIINLQDGKGYFLADDELAIRYAEQEMRRAIKIFNKARNILKRCNKTKGIKIPVKAHFRRLNKVDEYESQLRMEGI